jgi:DNA-binding response OmpR family regulator
VSGMSGGTILLVESDPQLGRGIAEQLLADGYCVELACSAAHARLLADRASLGAILHRAGGEPVPKTMLEIGVLKIDLRTRSVCVEGRLVTLRPLEFELLAHLAADARRVFSKDELLRAVWNYRAAGSTRTVDTHASRLRRKLDVNGSKRWVINVWGVGYRLL